MGGNSSSVSQRYGNITIIINRLLRFANGWPRRQWLIDGGQIFWHKLSSCVKIWWYWWYTYKVGERQCLEKKEGRKKETMCLQWPAILANASRLGQKQELIIIPSISGINYQPILLSELPSVIVSHAVS